MNNCPKNIIALMALFVVCNPALYAAQCENAFLNKTNFFLNQKTACSTDSNLRQNCPKKLYLSDAQYNASGNQFFLQKCTDSHDNIQNLKFLDFYDGLAKVRNPETGEKEPVHDISEGSSTTPDIAWGKLTLTDCTGEVFGYIEENPSAKPGENAFTVWNGSNQLIASVTHHDDIENQITISDVNAPSLILATAIKNFNTPGATDCSVLAWEINITPDSDFDPRLAAYIIALNEYGRSLDCVNANYSPETCGIPQGPGVIIDAEDWDTTKTVLTTTTTVFGLGILVLVHKYCKLSKHIRQSNTYGPIQ